jgi:hypothetical protein
MTQSLRRKDEYFRVPKNPPLYPDNGLPPWLVKTPTGIFARCPLCGQITTIRTCYGCQNVMCDKCLKEHQITCLREDK